jgi:hypothetical protein
MSGILGTPASLVQDITLLTQIGILILLLWGFYEVKGKRFMKHGYIMSGAIILHSVTILLVMIPSFILHFQLLFDASVGVIITWVHVLVGSVTLVLGGYLLRVWRFRRSSPRACMQRRWMMIPLFIFWTISLVFGIAFYGYFFL